MRHSVEEHLQTSVNVIVGTTRPHRMLTSDEEQDITQYLTVDNLLESRTSHTIASALYAAHCTDTNGSHPRSTLVRSKTSCCQTLRSVAKLSFIVVTLPIAF